MPVPKRSRHDFDRLKILKEKKAVEVKKMETIAAQVKEFAEAASNDQKEKLNTTDNRFYK